jgi:hypothetical protein
LQNPVGHRAEQGLLVGEVPIQRPRADVEFASEPPHGQVGDAVRVEERGRCVDHVGFVQLHTATVT